MQLKSFRECRAANMVWSSRVLAAAAAAKSLQSCPTLCDPIDGSPPGSPVPGILQARTLEWVAISFSNAWKWKVKVKSLSHVWLLATPWTGAYQAPPSMGFSRQEYYSGVPLPSPGTYRGLTFYHSSGFSSNRTLEKPLSIPQSVASHSSYYTWRNSAHQPWPWLFFECFPVACRLHEVKCWESLAHYYTLSDLYSVWHIVNKY